MGLDCGVVDMVQDAILAYIENEIIKFGKQRAGIPTRAMTLG